MLKVPEKEIYPPYYQEGMPGYVLRDWKVVDYKCYKLANTELWFRGPEQDIPTNGEYFSVIGAAQTFGCFCKETYVDMLSAQLQLPGVNFGYPGAGPSFFLKQPEILSRVNSGSFCVVQVMSGRSIGNSLIDNPHGIGYGNRRSDGKLVRTESVFEDQLAEAHERLPAFWNRPPFRRLTKFIPIPRVRRLMAESRQQWVRDYEALLGQIRVPTVLVWFSERSPAYVPRYDSRKSLFGPFPQMVNQPMLTQVKRAADYFVDATTDRGLPQPLVDRFTGETAMIDLSDDNPLYTGRFTENTYYPSPEMHEDAAAALATQCIKLLPQR